jgi:hypothetical protein
MIALRLIAIALLLGIAGQTDAAEPAVYDGLFVYTPQRSLFYPQADCARDPYWVTRDRGIQLNRSLDSGPYDQTRAARALRVRISGLLSAPGFYGYQGRYKHEVEVRHVIFANPAAPCP